MPDGVAPAVFYSALDANERKNGGAIEVKVAIPRVLTTPQQCQLAEELALALAGPCPVSWALHRPKAALEGGEQPHLHALISRRTPDGIKRPLEQIFKRYDPKSPETGGWKKDTGGRTYTEVIKPR